MHSLTKIRSIPLVVCVVAALVFIAPAFAQHGGTGGGYHGGYAGGYRGGNYGGYRGGYYGGYRGYYGYRGWYGGYYPWGWGWGWGGLGLGLYFATLPYYYSTYWYGCITYYYADYTYFLWDPAVGQYRTVAQPAGAPNQPEGQAPSELMVYPKNGQPPPVVIYNHVDEPYFDTMRVPLLRGRVFRENDDDKAPLVAIVNQTMAQQFWPNQDPLGKRFSLKSATGPFIEVVGLAADGKFIFIGFDKKPYFFVPLAQNYTAYRTLQVRSSLPPESMIAQMQNEVRALDPNMPVTDVQTMRQSLSGGNGFFIFQVGAILAASMGFLGLALAVVGVYGVVSFAASQRTHEIGIRMALGAGRRDILQLVLQQGLMLVIAGVLSGAVLAWALTRSMATILVGVSPTDALTYSIAILLLAAIGFWACYAPARRAVKLDPMVALRYE